jgi:hypothetical protein
LIHHSIQSELETERETYLYIPNFAKSVVDSHRIEPKQNKRQYLCVHYAFNTRLSRRGPEIPSLGNYRLTFLDQETWPSMLRFRAQATWSRNNAAVAREFTSTRSRRGPRQTRLARDLPYLCPTDLSVAILISTRERENIRLGRIDFFKN